MVFTFAAAVIVATVFMSRTPNSLLPVRPVETLERVRQTAQSINATNTPVPTLEWAKRIGIIAGHMGNERVPGVPDPGAVCEDGSEFTELQVTTGVATRLVALLRAQGFEVDLLNEFDPKLAGYQAAAIVSLHADSCDPEFGSGFKNAYPLLRETVRDKDTHLSECIRANYEAMTGLEFLPNQITPNMTQYHAWNEIAMTTPANILELGLLYHDRPLLKDQQDMLAQAVYNGVMCFLAPTLLATQQARPVATTPAPDGILAGTPAETPTLSIATEALVVTPSLAP
jgi:N-acetylmuramoyl-L-alanine amidase